MELGTQVIVGQIMFWGSIILSMVVLLAIAGFFIWKKTFVFGGMCLFYQGDKEKGYSLHTIGRQDFRWANKEHTQWKPLRPFFNQKKVLPFDPQYRYGNRRVISAKIGDEYYAAQPFIDAEGIAKIKVIPYDLRNIQSTAQIQNSRMFSPQGFWEQHLKEVLFFGVMLFCVVGIILTGYWVNEISKPATQANQNLASNIGQLNQNFDTMFKIQPVTNVQPATAPS